VMFGQRPEASGTRSHSVRVSLLHELRGAHGDQLEAGLSPGVDAGGTPDRRRAYRRV
jgi:hypothetical protein